MTQRGEQQTLRRLQMSGSTRRRIGLLKSYAVGNFIRIKPGESVNNAITQNFYLSETKTYESADYVFVPFGFSGVTINRTGDGLDASLVFPEQRAKSCLDCRGCGKPLDHRG